MEKKIYNDKIESLEKVMIEQKNKKEKYFLKAKEAERKEKAAKEEIEKLKKEEIILEHKYVEEEAKSLGLQSTMQLLEYIQENQKIKELIRDLQKNDLNMELNTGMDKDGEN